MRALRRLLVRALQPKGTQLQAWHIQSVSCICRAARALAVIRACASAVALRTPAAPPAFGWVGRPGIIDRCAPLLVRCLAPLVRQKRGSGEPRRSFGSSAPAGGARNPPPEYRLPPYTRALELTCSARSL